MGSLDNFESQLRAIQQRWDSAEKSIKIAEHVDEKVCFPAVQELRYSGRRVTEAIGLAMEGDEEKARARLYDAEFDCMRARHDAVDAATSKVALDLHNAASTLGHEAIKNAFNRLPELVEKLSEARKKIRSSRENRERRDDIYDDLEERDLNELFDLYNTYKSAQPVMEAFAKRERRIKFASLSIGAIGAIATIISIIATIF